MTATAVSENAHYHIVWQIANTPLVDYFPFETIEDARQSAEELRRPRETFDVKQYPDGCDLDCPAWKKRRGKQSK